MAFVDNLNDWYNRAVPDAEPVVGWIESAEGTRYRWKKRPGIRTLISVFIFGIMLLPWPGKHGESPAPFFTRLMIGAPIGGFIALLSWAFCFTTTSVYLIKNMVTIGAGRSASRFRLDTTASIRLEILDGYQSIVFSRERNEKERVFLEPESESEVFGFMVNAGLLDAAKLNAYRSVKPPASSARGSALT